MLQYSYNHEFAPITGDSGVSLTGPKAWPVFGSRQSEKYPGWFGILHSNIHGNVDILRFCLPVKARLSYVHGVGIEGRLRVRPLGTAAGKPNGKIIPCWGVGGIRVCASAVPRGIAGFREAPRSLAWLAVSALSAREPGWCAVLLGSSCPVGSCVRNNETIAGLKGFAASWEISHRGPQRAPSL